MSILYKDLTWQEIQEKIQEGYMAVLPCGCIEQSGPHLPVDVDSWSITHRVREGAERATEKYGVKVLVLPTLYYGPGHEHMGFPGTIRLSFETHLRIVFEIVDSLIYHGFRVVIVWPGCGGHHLMPAALEAKYKAKREGKNVRIYVPSADLGWLVQTDEYRSTGFTGEDFHAGEVTTSWLLAKRPQAVRRDKIVKPKVKPFSWDEARGKEHE